jgi:YggT family protein
VINRRNAYAYQVIRFLGALTELVFGLVRRVVPIIGGFDLSPMIVGIAIIFLRVLVLGHQ